MYGWFIRKGNSLVSRDHRVSIFYARDAFQAQRGHVELSNKRGVLRDSM